MFLLYILFASQSTSAKPVINQKKKKKKLLELKWNAPRSFLYVSHQVLWTGQSRA